MPDILDQLLGNDTFPKLLVRNAGLHPDKVAMREKEFGIWQPFTWREYHDHVRDFSMGLVALGLMPGDTVAIIGENCPEWIVALWGALISGIVISFYFPRRRIWLRRVDQRVEVAMLADRYPDGRVVWSPLVAISLLVWFVLAMQCMSTLAIVRRETGGWKWPIAASRSCSAARNLPNQPKKS